MDSLVIHKRFTLSWRACRKLVSLVLFLYCSPGAFCLGSESLIYQPGPLKPVDSTLKVAVGDPAPDFALPSLQHGVVRLSDYRSSRNVVITFVPAAWTPVCSAQWPGYNLLYEEFVERDTVVMGITVDNLPTLFAWTTEMGGLQFPVLSDFYPHGGVAATYGLLRSDGMTERALVVVDKQGIIQYIDVHNINERPPLEDLIAALDNINRLPDSPPAD